MKGIILISAILLLFSCVSRKVNKNNEKTEVLKEEELKTVCILKKDIVTDISTNINILSISNEFIITPIDRWL